MFAVFNEENQFLNCFVNRQLAKDSISLSYSSLLNVTIEGDSYRQIVSATRQDGTFLNHTFFIRELMPLDCVTHL